MKKDVVRISVDAEKLRAVKRYMEKKEVDLEDELADQLQKLYEKHVPINVREYIDEKQEEEIKAKRPKKSVKAKEEGDNTSIVQE
jgi:NAD+--asparagine ADP-ribosyltransferase